MCRMLLGSMPKSRLVARESGREDVVVDLEKLQDGLESCRCYWPIIKKACAPNPSDRFQTVAEFWNHFDTHRSGELCSLHNAELLESKKSLSNSNRHIVDGDSTTNKREDATQRAGKPFIYKKDRDKTVPSPVNSKRTRSHRNIVDVDPINKNACVDENAPTRLARASISEHAYVDENAPTRPTKASRRFDGSKLAQREDSDRPELVERGNAHGGSPGKKIGSPACDELPLDSSDWRASGGHGIMPRTQGGSAANNVFLFVVGTASTGVRMVKSLVKEISGGGRSQEFRSRPLDMASEEIPESKGASEGRKYIFGEPVENR